jgi:hypothetical protein
VVNPPKKRGGKKDEDEEYEPWSTSLSALFICVLYHVSSMSWIDVILDNILDFSYK